MSRPIIFNITKKEKINPNSFLKEKELQEIVEMNMEKIFNVKLLSSEYSFIDISLGKGRIDSLGIDEEGRPVIFEYKLNENENVINQSLFYMDWLKNHSGDFELLVLEKLGKEIKEKLLPDDKKKYLLDNPRSICIAKNFNKYDNGAINQMNADIQLIQYYLYDGKERIIAFEIVNRVDNSIKKSMDLDKKNNNDIKNKDDSYIEIVYENLDENKKQFIDNIIFSIQSISDEISFVWMKKHANFKVINSFASIVLNKDGSCKIYIPLNYEKEEELKKYSFIRDVKNIGHYGNGDVEIKVRNYDEFEKAMKFIKISFERNS